MPYSLIKWLTQTTCIHKNTINSIHSIKRRPHKRLPIMLFDTEKWVGVFFFAKTGKRHGAVLFKCSDGKGLWISHMKRTSSNNSSAANDRDQVPPFKLPSASVLPKDVVDVLPCIPEPPLYVPFGERPSTFQEVLYQNAYPNLVENIRYFQTSTHK